ncbi:MAG: sensor histidine kinase [Gemmatimonadales bacterium]
MKPRGRRSLRTELLVNLGLVTSAVALLVGVITALLADADFERTAGALVVLWAGSTAVFVVFGGHVVRRQVLEPLDALAAEAESLAAGRAPTQAPDFETAEFQALADSYRGMAEALLDVQSQIVRVEKLAGLGSLSAGVAHEVRNPLGAIGTYLDLLRRRGADPELAAAMRGAIERIERTVQSLLSYARPDQGAGVADVNAAVEASLEFLGAQALLKAQQVTVRLTADLPDVAAGRHGLEQVVVNLVINACQAAPGGVLVVSTSGDTYEPRHRVAHRQNEPESAEGSRRRRVRDGRWAVRPRRTDVAPGTRGVLLCVADDGPGVPESDRERIFDPFYTTKAPGKGTGLGLAIVARTVHEAGGTVWVDRAREGGAVFKVFLPAARTPAPERSLVESHAAAHR